MFVGLEITAPSKRVYTFALISLLWPIGGTFLALLAYFIQDWNWLQLAVSILPLLVGFLLLA